jgi:excisionase family DNA binding protein
MEVLTMGLDELPDMLRVDEAATVLRIGRSAAYEAVAVFQATGGAEGIPAIRIGRSVRVPKRALLRWIEAQLGAAAAEGSSDAA